ncbi:MAG TPA: gamma-glutamyltransferase family protein [Xanthobacteraceae bacterium]|nr:gamma-glutamyltransferase family protein [Xanthobacteraceae bacterium]
MSSSAAIRAPRAPIYGSRAMVVSGHSAATLAAIAVLKRGGHVVDAMVAASAVLTTVLGHATSIGGDCFLLFHDSSTGRTIGLNASGTAPAGATAERFPDGMQLYGPLAPVVPGLVRGWEAMHRRYGTLPWADLFDEAISTAEAHPVSHVLANWISAGRDKLAADPGCAALYLPDGRPISVGDTLRQPALAATLRRIAEQGADGFYQGETAERIGAYFAQHDGLISAADLAAYRPEWAEPVATTYRGHRVEVMPPNSYGMLLLMQLNGLSAIESQALVADPARRIAYQMDAMKAAFAQGEPWIADPRSVPDAVERLLGPAMVAAMQQAVLHGAAATAIPDRRGTSCLLIADAAGNAISLVQSVYNVFGSYFHEPNTGVLFNNRMQGFTHRHGQINSVGPGRRPAHTLCPVLVQRDGRVRFALASPGGLSQTLTNVQVLTALIDAGMTVAAAVEAPRWCNRESGTGDFLVEPEFSDSVVAALAATGHSVKRRQDPFFYGSAKAIERFASGNLAGAADHRREAFALGL